MRTGDLIHTVTTDAAPRLRAEFRTYESGSVRLSFARRKASGEWVATQSFTAGEARSLAALMVPALTALGQINIGVSTPQTDGASVPF